jgi:hypothetical protein
MELQNLGLITSAQITHARRRHRAADEHIRQIEANRGNTLQSTRQRTDEGKRQARRNALRDG